MRQLQAHHALVYSQFLIQRSREALEAVLASESINEGTKAQISFAIEGLRNSWTVLGNYYFYNRFSLSFQKIPQTVSSGPTIRAFLSQVFKQTMDSTVEEGFNNPIREWAFPPQQCTTSAPKHVSVCYLPLPEYLFFIFCTI